ncbi:glutathione S-transferase 1-like [Ciona intestinalis]
MGIELYFSPPSPPCRSVLMTLNALGLEYEIVQVDIFVGAHLEPDYLAINPRGKVPALHDGEYKISESAAIACYLCNKYEKDSENRLYPTCPQARGKVDQLLYAFENVYDVGLSYMNVPGVVFGNTLIAHEKLDEWKKCIRLVETFLEDKKFLASDNVTLADFFGCAIFLFLEVGLDFDFSEYPKVKAWLARVKGLEYFSKTHDEGLKIFSQKYKDGLAKNKAAAEAK